MKHIAGMKIYDIDRKKCMFIHPRCYHTDAINVFAVPTQQAILNELTTKERGTTVGVAGWIATGLRIQVLQWVPTVHDGD